MKVENFIRRLGKHLQTWGETIKAMRDHPDCRVREVVVKALAQDLPTYGETIKEMRGDDDPWYLKRAFLMALAEDPMEHYETIRAWKPRKADIDDVLRKGSLGKGGASAAGSPGVDPPKKLSMQKRSMSGARPSPTLRTTTSSSSCAGGATSLR